MPDPGRDFFEANRGCTEALVAYVDDFVDRNSHQTIEGFVDDTRPDNSDIATFHLHGAYSAQDFIDSELSITEAQTVADNWNNTARVKAAIAITGLQARISLGYDLERLDDIDPADQAAIDALVANSSRLLYFANGLWQESFAAGPDKEKVQLTRVALEGVEHYGKASEHTIVISDGLVIQSAHIVTIAEKVPTISVSAKAEENPFLDRLTQFIGGETFGLIRALLVGNFKNEEELDASLSEIGGKLRGTGQEEEIGPLLEELRIQALAQKHSTQLVVNHSLSQPNEEQFSNIAMVLERLSP